MHQHLVIAFADDKADGDDEDADDTVTDERVVTTQSLAWEPSVAFAVLPGKISKANVIKTSVRHY